MLLRPVLSLAEGPEEGRRDSDQPGAQPHTTGPGGVGQLAMGLPTLLPRPCVSVECRGTAGTGPFYPAEPCALLVGPLSPPGVCIQPVSSVEVHDCYPGPIDVVVFLVSSILVARMAMKVLSAERDHLRFDGTNLKLRPITVFVDSGVTNRRASHGGNACPARARRATFVLSILSLAPSLSSPWEVPQVDRTRPQTFSARHLV